jgi:hypothetical protein
MEIIEICKDKILSTDLLDAEKPDPGIGGLIIEMSKMMIIIKLNL